MSAKAQQVAEMLDMLPEQERDLAFELVKRLVIAWDPDFTKLTTSEKESLELSKKGEYYKSENIDFDNLEKLNLD